MIKPLADRILITPAAAESATKSGIIIPESAQSKQSRGVVVATGPGKTSDSGLLVPTAVAVGDTVLYEGAGATVSDSGADYILIRESNIIAIL